MQAALFECRRTVKFFYVKEYTLEMAIEDGVPGAQVRPRLPTNLFLAWQNALNRSCC